MNGIDNNQSSGNLSESPNPQSAIIGENIVASPAQETITYSSYDNNNPLPKRNWLKILLIVLLVIFFIAGGVFGYLFFNNIRTSLPSVTAEPSPVILPSPTPTLTPTATNAPTSVPPTLIPTKKPTPMATKVPTSTSAPVPTATPIPNPTINSSSSSGAHCQAVANPGFGPAPLTVSLTYSASNLGESYVTGIQWDYNGDNNWDTNLSSNNSQVTHTYTNVGVYTIKMQAQLSDGRMTDICSYSVAAQPH